MYIYIYIIHTHLKLIRLDSKDDLGIKSHSESAIKRDGRHAVSAISVGQLQDFKVEKPWI